jgi:serine/threonine protein phosphatase PrpC
MVSGGFPRPADRMVQAALNAGGVDNVTVVVIEPVETDQA